MSDTRPPICMGTPQADGYSTDPVHIIAWSTVTGKHWEARIAGHKLPFGQGKTQEEAIEDLLYKLTDPPKDYTVEVRIDPAE